MQFWTTKFKILSGDKKSGLKSRVITYILLLRTIIEKTERASQATEFSALVSFPVCLTQAMNVILSITTPAQISLFDRRRIPGKSETGLESINMDCIC